MLSGRNGGRNPGNLLARVAVKSPDMPPEDVPSTRTPAELVEALSAQVLDEYSEVRLPARLRSAYSLEGLARYSEDTFRPGQPVYVYFEVLDLWRNASGETHYRIACAVEKVGDSPATQEGRPTRATGGLSYACRRVGRAPAEGLLLKLDMPGSRPGLHRLNLRITEEETGKYVTGTRTFRVGDAAS